MQSCIALDVPLLARVTGRTCAELDLNTGAGHNPVPNRKRVIIDIEVRTRNADFRLQWARCASRWPVTLCREPTQPASGRSRLSNRSGKNPLFAWLFALGSVPSPAQLWINSLMPYVGPRYQPFQPFRICFHLTGIYLAGACVLPHHCSNTQMAAWRTP
jgi:hypothetical protein